jgi:hypothetical protein
MNAVHTPASRPVCLTSARPVRFGPLMIICPGFTTEV